MNVLLIGGGGREHALAWKMRQSPLLGALHAIPGHDALRKDGCQCPPIALDDQPAIVAYAKEHAIDLVVIGPEAPLVEGLADALRAASIPVFGPSKSAARLEGSKAFMKDLSLKYGIPTAAYGRFSHIEEAKAYIDRKGAPIVIKADGLAAGKGVIIAHSIDEAHKAVDDILGGDAFGEAGHEIVIEEFLDGEEVSFFAISDGHVVLPMASAQDHKAAFDGDKGPNTGGMGAYSPAHLMTKAMDQKVMATIIEPTIRAMAREGCPFQGVLFAGLMMIRRKDGTLEPKLLEYNVRFGDPECQALMMRMDSDILPLLKNCADGTLSGVKQAMKWKDEAALCVVMASPGYPASYQKGLIIRIPDNAAITIPPYVAKGEAAQTTVTPDQAAQIFHAGTVAKGDVDDGRADARDEGRAKAGEWLNQGGRVLGCTALGGSFSEAQSRAYALVAKVDWPQGFYRKDIGWRALQSDQNKVS